MAGSELRRDLGYDRPLYMLAFDHCDVFQELFEPELIPDAKRAIFDRFLDALRKAPGEAAAS